MSLIKQLWIAVASLMFMAFTVSFVISTVTTIDAYQEQLNIKNIDNVNSLALTLSQIEKDDVIMELMISAQFDTGHYSFITLFDPQGSVLVEKHFEGPLDHAVPKWFISLINLNVAHGVASVQDGWHQYGTLHLKSDQRFVYTSLWKTTQGYLLWFLLATLFFGVLSTFILKFLIEPLGHVVKQAEALGARRFITSKEPKTLEFKQLVRSMNNLTENVRLMLETESQRLEDLRYKNQHDPLTGVANRDYFNSLLVADLSTVDESTKFGCLMFHFSDLHALNHQLGHKSTDELIISLIQTINQTFEHDKTYCSDFYIGRLNGSDFALVARNVSDFGDLLGNLVVQLQTRLKDLNAKESSVNLALAASYFNAGDQRSELFIRLDGLLAKAELQNGVSLCFDEEPANSFPTSFVCVGSEQWRKTLAQVLANKDVFFNQFPVKTIGGEVIHNEVMMRVNIGGEMANAGVFIPWVRRLKLMPQFELLVAKKVVEYLRSNLDVKLAINISIETLHDTEVSFKLLNIMKQYSDVMSRLAIEFNERDVVIDIELIKVFCSDVIQTGCRLGIDDAGSGFAKIKGLHELGLDYLKLAASFSEQIESSSQNVEFVKGITTLAHSIGLKVIATGVKKDGELIKFGQIGIDGATGPAVN